MCLNVISLLGQCFINVSLKLPQLLRGLSDVAEL